jgi:hypothetical protein
MRPIPLPFEHALLGRVAARIINECRGINRVTYDITSKSPGTSEVEGGGVLWSRIERSGRRLIDNRGAPLPSEMVERELTD